MKCKENCTFSLITYTAKIVAKILRRIEKIIEDIFEEDQFQIGRAICVTFHNVPILMVRICQPLLEHPLWKANPWRLLHLN